ncbi:MAG: hypothetical protein K2V38_07015, partial [Gemmataceae bacterium]|nr:hypothetical protein [Gemmataceae bacterium]
ALAAEEVRAQLRAQADAPPSGPGVAGPATDAGEPNGVIARDDWWREARTRDPELARVCALHWFAGRTVQELAEALEVDRTTVRVQLLLADQQLALAARA